MSNGIHPAQDIVPPPDTTVRIGGVVLGGHAMVNPAPEPGGTMPASPAAQKQYELSEQLALLEADCDDLNNLVGETDDPTPLQAAIPAVKEARTALATARYALEVGTTFPWRDHARREREAGAFEDPANG